MLGRQQASQKRIYSPDKSGLKKCFVSPGSATPPGGIDIRRETAEKGRSVRRTLEKHPSGAKAHADLIAFVPGMNPRPTARTSFFTACKAHAILLALSARLKSCPVTKPSRIPTGIGFCAACEAVPFQNRVILYRFIAQVFRTQRESGAGCGACTPHMGAQAFDEGLLFDADPVRVGDSKAQRGQEPAGILLTLPISVSSFCSNLCKQLLNRFCVDGPGRRLLLGHQNSYNTGLRFLFAHFCYGCWHVVSFH